MISVIATAVALLAMGTGEVPVMNPSTGEMGKGPLVATLWVEAAADGRAEVVLRVVLRNVSDQGASFLLARPGAEFFVRDRRGVVVHAPVPCPQISHCSPGLPEITTLGAGAQMEFVERWRPGRGGLAPGPYTVKAKLHAYLGRRPYGVGEYAAFVPFILTKEIQVRGRAPP